MYKFVVDDVGWVAFSLAFGIFHEISPFRAIFGLVRYTPITLAVFEHGYDFRDFTIVLCCEGFQAAIFHEVSKVIQTDEIACYTIEITYPSKLRIVDRNTF
jgi:hypothetical protein